jgi:transposase-like protein
MDMVYIKVLCPYCGSDDVVLHGKNTNGKQRLLCKNEECSHKTFQLAYSHNACKPGVKQQIVDMAMNGSGTRDTGRVLGVSKDTVTSVLKKRKNSPDRSTKRISQNLLLINRPTSLFVML